MANATIDVLREANELLKLLNELDKDLEAFSFGDLRREIDKAASGAQWVVDALTTLDGKLDEFHMDEQEEAAERERAWAEMQADAAGY